jgi:hypothetical protein
MRFGRRIFAVIILVISGVGLVAYAYSIALQNQPNSTNPCASASLSSNTYGANFQGTQYYAQNVTFTDSNQRITVVNPITRLGVQFETTSFSDASVPHLENGLCVSTSPPPQASITVKITFNTGYSETLSLNYKGGLPEQSSLTVQLHPRAGLLWQPGKSYLILLISQS